MPFGLVEERLNDILTLGVRELQVTLGALAQIEDQRYELVAVQSNSGAYVADEKYALGNSFCKKVMESEKTLSETKTGSAPLKLHHPLYSSLPLECFIGAPVYMHGDLWGCLDFTSMVQRDKPFSKRELMLATELAQEMSDLISSSGFLREE